MTTGTVSAIEQTALTTAEQLLPVLLQAVAAGSTATTPMGVLIAMVAEIVPPLIQSFGATSSQIQQLMTALVVQINAGQQVIDQAAAARGIPVESVASAPIMPAATNTPAA
ncbi:MAG: hypothetical protein ACYCY2_02390 [Acidithiobacillus ferriphilus]